MENISLLDGLGLSLLGIGIVFVALSGIALSVVLLGRIVDSFNKK